MFQSDLNKKVRIEEHVMLEIMCAHSNNGYLIRYPWKSARASEYK